MATSLIDQDRWASVQERGLAAGNHNDPAVGMCVMEAVSYITRETFSDHPQCACPVITAFMMSWNDGLPDDERAQIIPLIPKLVGTRGSKALEERRSLMAADWLVRVHTPAWLRLAGMTANADALGQLPEITSLAQVPSIKGPIEAARRDAEAARAAARAAARDAARDAARAAARAAAWDAAWDAARAAARAAACDAAWAKLSPTKELLQRSAHELVERMCAATDADGGRAEL